MHLRVTSTLAIVSLLLTILWFSSVNARTLLQFVTCAAAVMVALHAARARQYAWCVLFSAVVLLYNPLVPLALGRSALVWLDITCVLLFGFAMTSVHATPRLTIVSIVNESPRSESV